jgi:hypothetical protein
MRRSAKKLLYPYTGGSVSKQGQVSRPKKIESKNIAACSSSALPMLARRDVQRMYPSKQLVAIQYPQYNTVQSYSPALPQAQSPPPPIRVPGCPTRLRLPQLLINAPHPPHERLPVQRACSGGVTLRPTLTLSLVSLRGRRKGRNAPDSR